MPTLFGGLPAESHFEVMFCPQLFVLARACQSVILDSLSTAVQLMRKTRSGKWLRVTVRAVR